MTKKEFINLYYEKGEFKTKVETEKAANAFLETIEDILVRGEEITFAGFGKFEVVKREARIGRNPRTGKEVKIEATKAPKFKAGRNLKEKVAIKKK